MYNHVPLDGSATYAALAHAAGLSEIKTRSILRHAMTKRIFAERDGCVVHTAVSAMFVRNPYLADWIGHMCDDALPAVTAVPKMIDLYGTSAAPNHSAINVAFDTSLNGNVFIATHPVRGPRFFRGLRCLTATGMFRNSFLVDGYPWHEFKTVVDVSF
jgi:6-hydroxytryprostatin B O-methyltransferase